MWTVPPIFSSSRISRGAAVDPVVGADPELAEAAGALVGVEHLDQELLAALGAGVDDLAALEAKPHAGDLAAADQSPAGGR